MEENQEQTKQSQNKSPNDNKQKWETIFNAVPDENEVNNNSPIISIKDKSESSHDKTSEMKPRINRNDMFTRNAINEDEEPWIVYPLVPFRNPIIAKPSDEKYDGRVLFIIPYTTLKKDGVTIDLYYTIIENHLSGDNEIFNFSILSSDELYDLFGIDLIENTYNAINEVTDKIFDNLDTLISLKGQIKDEKIFKNIIKGIIKG